jgi:hypothetical protein
MAKKAEAKAKPKPKPKPKPLPDLKLTRGKNGRVQWRAVGAGHWTMKKRTIFLDCLAATCNITVAAKMAGLSANNASALRRRDPEFAEQFRAALETGYIQLEALMLQRALAGQNAPLQLSEDPGEDGKLSDGNGAARLPEPEAITNEQALRLLAHYQRTIHGVAPPKKGGGRRPSMATEEETNAELLKRLKILHRRKLKEAGDEEAQGN